MGKIANFYGVWDRAFAFFNAQLFDGELEAPAFTVEKTKGSHGYFFANQWKNEDGETVHQLTMNSTSLQRDDKVSMSTFCHELAHLWQQQGHNNGWEFEGKKVKPGRGKYHNAQWAKKMVAIGLQPKSFTTGEKGTGDKVTHEIVDGGRFDEAWDMWERLNLKIGMAGVSRGVVISLTPGAERQVKAKRRSKTKYTCGCGNNVWGKPGLLIRCCECDEEYEEELI